MSDFDAALERLIADPAFRAALEADPARALAGYRLSPDELELLHAQVDTGAGGQRQVEQRTSKASLFGLLSPLGGAGGIGSGLADAAHGADAGPGFGSAGGYTPAAPAYGTAAAGMAAMGDIDLNPPGAGHAEMGSAAAGHAELGSVAGGHAEMGSAAIGHAELGSAAAGHAEMGSVSAGHAEMGSVSAGHAELGSVAGGHAEMGSAAIGHAEMGSAGAGYAETGPAAPHHAAPAGPGSGIGGALGGFVAEPGSPDATAAPRGTLYSSAAASSAAASSAAASSAAAGIGEAGIGGAGVGGAGVGGAGVGGAGTSTWFSASQDTVSAVGEPVEPGRATLHSAQPPADYHTRVDADGDGRWDRFTAVDRGDRGVDLVVDRDNDGRAEFVGHDYDRDGLIDEATTDTDRDGRLDTRWVDDNGDGWLDRRIQVTEPDPRESGPRPEPGVGRHRQADG